MRIVVRNLGYAFGIAEQTAGDLEAEVCAIGLLIVPDKAMDHSHLRLHASSRDGVADLPTRPVVELSGVITAPIITLDGSMLEIPFVDIPGSILPARS